MSSDYCAEQQVTSSHCLWLIYLLRCQCPNTQFAPPSRSLSLRTGVGITSRIVTRPLALERLGRVLGRWQQRPGETVAPLQMLKISVKLNFPLCFLQFWVNLASPIQFKPLADAKNGLTVGQSSLALPVPRRGTQESAQEDKRDSLLGCCCTHGIINSARYEPHLLSPSSFALFVSDHVPLRMRVDGGWRTSVSWDVSCISPTLAYIIHIKDAHCRKCASHIGSDQRGPLKTWK